MSDEKKTGMPGVGPGVKPEPTFTKDDMTNAMTAIAKSIAEEMTPIVMAAASAASRGQNGNSRPVHNPGPVCPCCKQLEKACGGVPKIDGVATQQAQDKASAVNHVKMVVYPTRYPEFADWFRGRGLNGVWYLSNNASHAIWVPKDAAGDFKHAIEVFEQNERETRMGRSKQHNSGSLSSPKQVSDMAAQEGWR